MNGFVLGESVEACGASSSPSGGSGGRDGDEKRVQHSVRG